MCSFCYLLVLNFVCLATFQLYLHYINDYYWNFKIFLKSVTSFRGGGQRFVTVCDRGEVGGSKIAKNSVTSFMDGP